MAEEKVYRDKRETGTSGRVPCEHPQTERHQVRRKREKEERNF